MAKKKSAGLQKNKKLLPVIIIIVIIGITMFTYRDVIAGYATGLMDFVNDEDMSVAQCTLSAGMTAFGENGVITKQIFQSSYYLEGEIVESLLFEVDFNFVGAYVDWNTLKIDLNLYAYPSGESEILLKTISLTGTSDLLETSEGKYAFNFNYLIGEPVDNLDGAMSNNGDVSSETTLEILFGEPVDTLAGGIDIYNLDIRADVVASIVDTKGQTIRAGVDIYALWQFNSDPDGTLGVEVGEANTDVAGETIVDPKDVDTEKPYVTIIPKSEMDKI